jgi:hypothetical protein
MDRFSVTQAIQPKTDDGQSLACLQLVPRRGGESPQISEPRVLRSAPAQLTCPR